MNMQHPKVRPILRSFAYALDFMAEQVAGISESDRVRQPAGILNHPAWIIGHVTYVAQMICGALGAPPWLPDSFAQRYGPGSVPTADATNYETPTAALASLREAADRLTRALEALDESQLDAPFPDPAYRETFPTLADALTQVLVGHTSYHVGQLGAWRKAIGFAPLQRGFE